MWSPTQLERKISLVSSAIIQAPGSAFIIFSHREAFCFLCWPRMWSALLGRAGEGLEHQGRTTCRGCTDLWLPLAVWIILWEVMTTLLLMEIKAICFGGKSWDAILCCYFVLRILQEWRIMMNKCGISFIPSPYLSLSIDQSISQDVSDNWNVPMYVVKYSLKNVFLPLTHFPSLKYQDLKIYCSTQVKILNTCVIIRLHLLILLNCWHFAMIIGYIYILSAWEILRKRLPQLFRYGILFHEWIQANKSQRKTRSRNTQREIPLPQTSCEFISPINLFK